MRWIQVLLTVIVCILSTDLAVGQSGSGEIQIKLVPMFNEKPLQLDSVVYVNPHGDSLTISMFRCYLTNVVLTDGQGHKSALQRNSHLFDAEDSSTYRFTVTANAGTYQQLSFTIGVDSTDNTSGAMAGDLDPAKGMYWAWNSGYIMAKLEGKSKVCKTLHQAFEFHIGGYMPPYNTERQQIIALEPVTITFGSRQELALYVDINAFFSRNLDLSVTNSIVIPGKEAAAMADRYAKMFKIVQGKK